MALRVTQIGAEVWIASPAGPVRTTQVGAEPWIVSPIGPIRTTQIGAEVWINWVPFVPPPHGHGPPPPPPKGGKAARETGSRLQRWRRENRDNITGLQQFLAYQPQTPPPPLSEDMWHQAWSIPRTLQLRGIHANKTQALIPGQEIAPIIPPIPPGTTEAIVFPPWSEPQLLPRVRGVNPIRTGAQQDFIPAGPKEIFVQGTWASVEINADVFSANIDNVILPRPPYKVRASIVEIPAIRRAAASLRGKKRIGP